MEKAAEAEWVRCPHPVLQQTYHSGGPDTAHILVDCEVCHAPTRVDTCAHVAENERLRAIVEVREGTILSLQSIELAEIERLRAANELLTGVAYENAHLRATITRVRDLAEKYRDWKGAPNPIGPLHGAGMVSASNEAGKAFLVALTDGTVTDDKA